MSRCFFYNIDKTPVRDKTQCAEAHDFVANGCCRCYLPLDALIRNVEQWQGLSSQQFSKE